MSDFLQGSTGRHWPTRRQPRGIVRFQLSLLAYSYTRAAEACRRLMESRGMAWYVSSSGVGLALAALVDTSGDARGAMR